MRHTSNFQDFTSKVQKKRSRYAPVRKILKRKNMKTHLLYRTKLKVDGGPTI